MQGLPDTFIFPDQPAAATYRQMGNGVNVGAVWHVMRQHVIRDRALLEHADLDVSRLAETHPLRQRVESGRAIVEAVRHAPLRPNEILAKHRPARAAAGSLGDDEFLSRTAPGIEELVLGQNDLPEVRETA